MAVNTHKHGYSTSEVAQVFGCSVTHIHQLIEGKKLGASITESNRPNGRRTIRIEREHIQQYMRDNPKRFSNNERKAWGVEAIEETDFAKEKAEATKSTIRYVTGDPTAPSQIRTTQVGQLDPDKYPTKPTAAWADLLKEKKSHVQAALEETATVITQSTAPTVSPKAEGPVTYSILVNGKVAVSGIAKDTAVAIVQALLHDTGTGDFTAIAILKNIPKGGAR